MNQPHNNGEVGSPCIEWLSGFDMFWTAFIWGLGVSSGACFGLLMFFVLKSGLDCLMNTKRYKKIEDFNERSVAALIRRNELSGEMIEHMAAIAAAAERYEDSVKTESR